MRRALGISALLGMIVLKVPLHAAKPAATQEELTIHVYNYAQAPTLTILRAEGEAGRILREAGIRVVWLNCPTTTNLQACQEKSPTNLTLRIIPHAAASLSRRLLGFALPAPEGAIHATIFYSRVQELARDHVASEPKILGHAIAHEIGHLLLGSQRHSANGLMRVRWSRSDWRLADVEQLRFSRQQAIAMRSELAKRTKQITDNTIQGIELESW